MSNDKISEITEGIGAQLQSHGLYNLGNTQFAIAQILDNDGPPPPILRMGSPVQAAGTEGAVLYLEAYLDRTTTVPVSFDFTTEAGQTTPGLDYIQVSGRYTIPAGQLSILIPIQTIDDILSEGDELFMGRVSNSTNAVLAPSNETTSPALIRDNEPLPVINIEDGSATEGSNVIFHVTLDRPSANTTRFIYTPSDGTASRLTDFNPSGVVVQIPAGQTAYDLVVGTTSDGVPEETENFFANIGEFVNLIGGRTTAVGTIFDVTPAIPSMALALDADIPIALAPTL